MTWLKLSDDFAERAAEAGLSDSAVRTHLDAMSYIMKRECEHVLSDRDLVRACESENAEQAAKELLGVGWWTPEPDGRTRVVFGMEHQPEPAILAKRRAADAERQRRKRLLDNLIDPETGEQLTPEQAEAIRDAGRSKPRASRRDSRRDVTPLPGSGRVGTGAPTEPPTDAHASDEPEGWPTTAHVPGTCIRCHRELPSGLVALGRTSHETGTCPTEEVKP